jgi:hypothetical protein
MRAEFLITVGKLPFDGARLQENRSLVAFVFPNKYSDWARVKKEQL